ncbi:MAG: hypothetical protein FD128_2702 [Hyphomonadaceae bacterium]|nr:MAG: hypothetical protein FD128_2702 [Hyphomonadaceae bacterium]
MPELSIVEDKIISVCRELLKFKETNFHYVWEPGNPEKIYASPYRMDVVAQLKSKNETNWGLEELDRLFPFAITTIGDERTYLYTLPRLWLNVKEQRFYYLSSASPQLLSNKFAVFFERVQYEELTSLIIEISGYAIIAMNLRLIDWELEDLWEYENNADLFYKEAMQLFKDKGFEYSI